MSTLGTVNLSLSLQDRTIDVAVPPIQAAIIGAFDGDRGTRKQTILCDFSRPFFLLSFGNFERACQRTWHEPNVLAKTNRVLGAKGRAKGGPAEHVHDRRGPGLWLGG